MTTVDYSDSPDQIYQRFCLGGMNPGAVGSNPAADTIMYYSSDLDAC